MILEDFNWVSKGAVTPVKDQTPCGSCWAFSAIGGIEGLSKISYGELKTFSAQQLVDCSGKYGNDGCEGGDIDYSFNFIKENGILLD